MAKPNMSALFKNVKMKLSKHSPEILTGLGIAGMIVTTVMAVRATPKALELIEAKKEELELDSEEKLHPVDVVKATWKCYVPAVVTGVTSTACLIGASSANLRRNTALATAYNLSATALSEYKEKVLETVGEKKEQVIRNKIAEERINKEPVNQSAIIVSGNGNTRCFDTITKQRFISDIEAIKRIVNELNRRMVNGEDYISLNDFYCEIGIDPVSIGDELGWNVTRGLIEVSFSAQLDTDGVPCIVLDYDVAPKRGFNRWS
jgi:ribosomal protein L9